MTVKHHLDQISDPEVKKRALKNLYKERAGEWANSQEHALFVAFLWNKSPEGLKYWTAVHHNMKYPNDLMPVPAVK